MPATLPPTYPVMVASDAYTINDKMPACNNFGPHEHAGRLYIVAGVYDPGGPLAITVFRSIDNGLSWQECDTANRKVTVLSAFKSTAPVGVQVKGSDLIIAMNSTMEVHRFSMYSSSWEAPIATAGPTVDDGTGWLGGLACIYPARRSDGTAIAQYQTTRDFVGGVQYEGRFRYAIYNAGWTDFSVTGFGIGDFKDEMAAGACLNEVDDRFNMFFITADPGTGDPMLRHASVAMDGTLSGITTVDALPLIDGGNPDISQPICVGGILYIAYCRNNSGTKELVVATAASGVSPSFTAKVVPLVIPAGAANQKNYPIKLTNMEGCVLSLAFGGAMMGVLFSGNPDDTSTNNQSLYYLQVELLANDPDALYLFSRILGSSDPYNANFIYSRLPAGGVWTNPVELYSMFDIRSVIGTRVLCDCSVPTPGPAGVQRAVIY